MKASIAKLLVEASESLGIDVSIRDSYSGRGMYGASTAGIVFDSWSDLVQCAFYAGAEFERLQESLDEESDVNDQLTCTDDVLEQLSSLRTDNMGRSLIAY